MKSPLKYFLNYIRALNNHVLFKTNTYNILYIYIGTMILLICFMY